MAKVLVYYWDHVRSGPNAAWGHTALQIEGGPYISWWPARGEDRDYLVDRDKNPHLARLVGGIVGTSNVYKVKHRCNTSLQADITDEGRGPDRVVEIASGVLDTQKMSLWWKGYEYEKATYHTIKKNCSTTVIRALRAGGSDKLVRSRSIDFFSKQKGWEPTDVMDYLRKMNRSLGDARVNLTGKAANTPPPNNPSTEFTGVEMCREHGMPKCICLYCEDDGDAY